MSSTSISRGSTSGFWNVTHLVCAVVAAVALGLLVWVWHPSQPRPDTVEAAAYHVFWVALSTLIYLAVQGYATLHTSAGGERRVLADILLSCSPLLVIGYGLLDFARGHLPLNLFQGMTLTMWGIASAIDVLIYSSFSLRIIRRSSELNINR